MSRSRFSIVRSQRAATRVARAEAWLCERAPAERVLVIAPSAEAGQDLLRAAAARAGAAFGWRRATLAGLAADLASEARVDRGLAPVGRIAAEAVASRAVHRLNARNALGRFASVAACPGFARAIATTIGELRLTDVDAARLADAAPETAELLRAYADELDRARLIDRAGIFALAAEVASRGGHPLLGLPTLLLDVPIDAPLVTRLVRALAAAAPELVAVVPSGDGPSIASLREALGVEPEDVDREHAPDGAPPSARGRTPATAADPATPRATSENPATSSATSEDVATPRDDATGASTPIVGDDTALVRLQTHLFSEDTPDERGPDGSVDVLSAPGENRECVEIARRILEHARRGTPFDRIAILTRSPEEYRAHLEEALGRASVPAWFARGTLRPDPAGRAFVALLRSAREGLSARRFAEYLSLGEVPDADVEGRPPAPLPSGERWASPDDDLVPTAAAASEPDAPDGEVSPPEPARTVDPDTATVVAGTLRAPRRWERLLVDASVIGSLGRWRSRLDGLAHELELDLADLDADDPRAERIARDLRDLASLRGYALPLLEELASLPASADWAGWIERLGALATRTLRRPERVLSVLAALAPMGDIGPVSLDEVVRVLERHLLEVAMPPVGPRYGRVFVAPPDAARGMRFDVVFVPGLAERLFPRKVVEEPILLDRARRGLDDRLLTNDDRVERERLALRLAVGAASRALVLSYPRIDSDQARPRVPSFYALEALRAAEGRLPGFDELARRAEEVAQVRIGWPGPPRRDQAIDDAEYDLSLLQTLVERDPQETVGAARYLLGANEHLARALRFRARRWRKRWSPADGLVQPSDHAREALAAHLLAVRSFSPTALQNYASCPYRFFLYAVHRLAPREEAEAIEEMDALQRGSLVHDVQFELLTRLRAERLLPVTPDSLDRARDLLDEVLEQVARRHREKLAPAIARVWEDGITAIRADLREWLRRASEDDTGFVPWRFELSFGLPERRPRDPDSVMEDVAIEAGIRLRGSIDLVERRADGAIRVTDHKTGKVRFEEGKVISGGEHLQPVLYALVAERMFAGERVVGGRLYYCTSAGGFEARDVPLDDQARDAARAVADAVGTALASGFLPAAPADRACDWCDYRVVCGPYEERRSRRKPPEELRMLQVLRSRP
jgi:RecB family exonuclease